MKEPKALVFASHLSLNSRLTWAWDGISNSYCTVEYLLTHFAVTNLACFTIKHGKNKKDHISINHNSAWRKRVSHFFRITIPAADSCRSCFGGCVFNTFLWLETTEVFSALPHFCQEAAVFTWGCNSWQTEFTNSVVIKAK